MYRYTLVYTTTGALPLEAPSETIFWCDDRSDAMQETYKWIHPRIINGDIEYSGSGWAILCNRKGETVAYLLGNAAMGFYWKERAKYAYF